MAISNMSEFQRFFVPQFVRIEIHRFSKIDQNQGSITVPLHRLQA